MNKIKKYFCTALVIIFAVFTIQCSLTKKEERPKLIVIITLDQFRADYLEKYDETFTDGFRRLRDEGWRYDRAIVDHAPTLSWPGHTTIHTGAYPKNHGVASNEIIDENGRRKLLFLDPEEKILDHTGGVSFTPTITKVTGFTHQ